MITHEKQDLLRGADDIRISALAFMHYSDDKLPLSDIHTHFVTGLRG